MELKLANSISLFALIGHQFEELSRPVPNVIVVKCAVLQRKNFFVGAIILCVTDTRHNFKGFADDFGLYKFVELA